MNIEQTLETSYISLDNAFLRVIVKDVTKYEDLFQLHYIGDTFLVNDVEYVDMVPDNIKRENYQVPDFVEQIRKHPDSSIDNCLLIMVLDGYDIIELHNWIQAIEKNNL